MKYICIISVFVAILFGSCTKNEFKLVGELEGAGTQNIRVIYYASDDKGGYVVDDVVPIVNGSFEYNGICRHPSVVWLFRSDRTLLNLLYVERGDEMKIKGAIEKPFGWAVEGNELQEKLSAWQQDNENLLMSGDAMTTSRQALKYIESNPNDKLSTLLLLVYYTNADNRLTEYWSTLTEEAKDEFLLNAVSGERKYMLGETMVKKVRPMQLVSIGDSMTILNPTKSALSVLYFWRNGEDNHSKYIGILKQLSKKYEEEKRLKIADINFDIDTLSWHESIEKDSIEEWDRMWSVGGEMNRSIYQLRLPYTPYFVLLDSVGHQLYRGVDTLKIKETVETMFNTKKEK